MESFWNKRRLSIEFMAFFQSSSFLFQPFPFQIHINSIIIIINQSGAAYSYGATGAMPPAYV